MAKKHTRDAIEFKLKEAEFFLEKIFDAQGSMDTPYYFSAFLSAARAVTTMLFNVEKDWATKTVENAPKLLVLRDYRNSVIKEAWRGYAVTPALYINTKCVTFEDYFVKGERPVFSGQQFQVQDLNEPTKLISLLDHSEALFQSTERLFYKAIEDEII